MSASGYWRDVGTLDALYDANMDLVAPVPVFNLYNQQWPVYTYRKALPPAKVSRGSVGEPAFVDGSLLCQGSVISGAHVERSIVSPSVFIDHDAHVTDSILNEGVRVGAGAQLNKCIVDKNVVIPRMNELASTMNLIVSGITCQSTASLSFKKNSASTDGSQRFRETLRARSMRMPPTAIAMAVIVHIIG